MRRVDLRVTETPNERERRLQDARVRNVELCETETLPERELHDGEHELNLNNDILQQEFRRKEHIRRMAAANKKKHNLGVVDVDFFCENDFSPDKCHHQLPILFDESNVCTHCKSYKWKEERPGFCCELGKIQLENIPSPPIEIENLYSNQLFLNNIRKYNNALSLASLGMDKEITHDGYSPTVTLQGKLYHLMGSLLPEQNASPKFAQIYFVDSEHETENRLQHNPGLDTQILKTLQQCLHSVNPYIRSFKAAIEMQDSSQNIEIVLDARKRPSAEHARRFNLPTGSEVAVIMPGDQTGSLDVVIHTRNGPLQRIKPIHRSYDPLHYIVLFPFGSDGFHLDIINARDKKVTPSEFYRYVLQIRYQSGNFILKSKRLAQQYACDQFAKIEGERLKYIKLHQTEIRADKYKGLLDAIDNDDSINAGKKVILPPTVYGSPRFYAEAFQDAMSVVRHYGKPSLFITFTCNPKWPEILSSLFTGETPADRPDLCVRVFNIKLNQLLKDLTKTGILGKVVAFTAVKEDQKRGLPHCHILLILSDDDKPKDSDDVDRYVCAEIPDPRINPRLYAIVTKHNIHGPCGNINRNSPCMSGEAQTRSREKDFPKQFTHRTLMTESTYPMYRRRSPEDGGRIHTLKLFGKQNFNVDNSWIVPYNPFLSLKYDAHINVEVVHSVKAVKYLYKYITKGSDRVMFRLADGSEIDITNDEIERFQMGRYISASEAYWRIYEFKIQHLYPPVMKLPCHLEDEQFVTFQSNNAAAVALAGPPMTKLTAWFDLNTSDIRACDILYPDIPKYYTWNRRRWERRKKVLAANATGDGLSDMIGRIPIISLSPHQSELYHLRMLLYHKPGATSFKHLKTIEGEEQPTFQAACNKLGLLDDDSEIDKAIQEASAMKFGNQLRDVFATILIWIRPSDPPAFYLRHKNCLCQDYRDVSAENAENQLLIYLRDRLDREGLQLSRDFGLPEPTDVIHLARELQEELDYDIATLQDINEKNLALLSDEQRSVYNVIVESVDQNLGKLISLDAPGGTGKTFIITTILAHVRASGKVALATAVSGIAATLLPNGRTLHSRLKVPLNITDDSTCNIMPRSATAELLRQCKLLVIDEVTMADRRIYEAIDRSLKDIRKDDRHFGGLTVMLSGDWRQILPIVRKGSRADVVDATFKSSPLFQHFTIMHLTRNMRVALSNAENEDKEFAYYVLKVGEGKLRIERQLGQHKIRLDENVVFPSNKLEMFCEFVFPDLEKNFMDSKWITSRAILCPTNDGVDKINNYLMNKMPGISREYRSSDKIMNIEEQHLYPEEFLNTLHPSGMPQHRLSLKEKSPIMLLRNLDSSQGHCNGTRYVVNALNDHIIDATVATGIHVGKRIFIPRIPLAPSDNLFPFQMQRRQFPVRLSFAMTSNKSQGQTLERCGIYLEKDFFSHGQLYVAMSRVGRFENVKLLTQNGTFLGHDGIYTDNTVYHEVLS